MEQLKPESLDWALTHIQRFGDTDIFPVPFEYEAIKHSWSGLRDKLATIDIAAYECRSLHRTLVPKPKGGYRVAIQLDPIDALIYTASIYEAADVIEKQRIPAEQKVACSYRVQPDAKGQLFRTTNGWNDYHEKSQLLAESGKYNFVVVADIADFYNQISHHRIENALEIAGVTPSRAKSIERFLGNLTALQSRGVPVGPTGSIVLAEACLSDVDLFLLRKGYTHTRYVDDFRIFCISRSQAYSALHDLSEYLYTAHRLALQSDKTKPLPVESFLEEELFDPQKVEEQRKRDKINETLEAIFLSTGYVITEDDLPLVDIQHVVRENLVELFAGCLSTLPLPQGLARYLLRRGAILRTAVLQEFVLNNLEVLSPVFRDAMLYLLRTSQAKTATRIGSALIHFAKTSDLAFLPYLRMWLLHILTEKFAIEFGPSITELCENTGDKLRVRPRALRCVTL